jgi:hypothetical protein
MEEQTPIEKLNVLDKSLSLVEKSLSIQKERKEMKEKRNKIFKAAIEDAEQTALNSLCFPEEQISRLLEQSEKSCGLRQIKWVWILRNEEDFIPFSDGIETPTMWKPKTKQYENVKFRFSRFFKKEQFINKCNDYYKQYNCFIEVKRTKGPRWEISIIPLDE